MKRKLSLGTLAVVWLLTATSAWADVKLPSVIGSHMVLQRDRPIVLWGWADPGEAVSVSLDGAKAEAAARADARGDWKVTLPAVSADGKAHCLTVRGKNTIELTDILIGEVWLGSGQSNMEWPMMLTTKPQEAIAAAKHPEIRLFHVPKVQTPEPAKDVAASWKACSPETIPAFSGVLYYYGLKLHQELKVPVGLINDSWGGSPIEAWLSGPNAGGMYKGMIAPVKPFALAGVIWYQGESNHAQGVKYFDHKKSLIEGWRGLWGYDFPFYFVQIAPWSGYQPGLLPPLWEGQAKTLKIPGTGMAVATDLVDDIKDIHPKNKLDVGNRLALWALAKHYGRKGLVYSGPLYKSMAVEGDKIRLCFAHTGGGLKSRDGKPLSEFEIAGPDGKFVPAEATIDGAAVLVSAKGVTEPKQARFGWRNTCNPNLCNAEGLPAAPFHTNNWQGGTGE